MMEQQAGHLGTLVDGKTLLGIGTATGGGFIALTEVSQLALTGVSILVGIFTCIYIYQGIKTRRLENALLKQKIYNED